MDRLLRGGVFEFLVEDLLGEVGHRCVHLEHQLGHNDVDRGEGHRAELVSNGSNDRVFAGREGRVCRGTVDPLRERELHSIPR